MIWTQSKYLITAKQLLKMKCRFVHTHNMFIKKTVEWKY